MTSADVIDAIGKRLARAAPPNSRVVLFGSHARGTADPSSDYDVLVIEPNVASPIRESVRLRDALDELDVPIDVVVIDEAKAARRGVVSGTMVEQALREGRLLAST
ncbi:nucleotidyltransferase domain-containing protein [Conexibacter woesei]|uniref:DNA polymerase beta domain protein region n=1 Tax=Conexibacter woesei (strain DSM 14684 / CCUG 47730 / CIP 108061 / JCM 11494 / NBRC 100937 / ID131577) TaxID=469383 RepID=D3F3L4_CONWI|nr:nucleotidyltransferase domain-containing protein [Conexibacter woesei]ADB52379.1 DNA polymerase beta domain protein region [Conexibacter woesei DSM 14684]